MKYIVDDTGRKTSVLVPLKTWEELNNNYQKLLNKIKVLTGIQDALQEVKHAGKAGRDLQTLKSFLHERNR
jgi:hypothetical protein